MEPIRHNRGLVLSHTKGFTLMELLVVLTIIIVITMVVLTSQSSFNKTLVLANTAYDVALTLRSAQKYGLGSRASGSIVNAGYGLHFSSGVQDSFTLFADTSPSPSSSSCHGLPTSNNPDAPDAKAGNCKYDEGDSIVFPYRLNNGIKITKLCVNSSCNDVSKLDIVFSRPNPDALISVNEIMTAHI
jgi:prepilin-type N-terminal cleavage/methylation domain-containing protein